MRIEARGGLSLEYQLHKDKFYKVPSNESLKTVGDINNRMAQKVAGRYW